MAKGGKGDDFIGSRVSFNQENNRYEVTDFYEEDEDGNILAQPDGPENARESFGRGQNEIERLYGEQGDDTIFGGRQAMTTQAIHGGSGDDKVYGGYSVNGETLLYGNSGRDIVRSDWYRTNGLGTEENDGGDEWLFGDYKYGEDALDKDLWGDDDFVYGGYGGGDNSQYMYGGDGNDYLSAGYNWDV